VLPSGGAWVESKGLPPACSHPRPLLQERRRASQGGLDNRAGIGTTSSTTPGAAGAAAGAAVPGRRVQTSFAAFDLLNPEPFANSVYESVSNTEHLVRTSVFHNLGLDASGNVMNSGGGGIENSSSDASSSARTADAASPVAAAWAASAVANGGGSGPSSGSPRSTAAAAGAAGGPFSDMFAARAGEFDGDDEGNSAAPPPVSKLPPGIGGLD